MSGPKKIDTLWARQPNATAMICHKDRRCHRMLSKYCLVYWDKCVPAGLNVLPQILTHPIILNPTPFAPLFGRGACTQLVTVLSCLSLKCLSCPSLVFIMPVIDVCHACPSCLSGLPSMNQVCMMYGYLMVYIRIAIFEKYGTRR